MELVAHAVEQEFADGHENVEVEWDSHRPEVSTGTIRQVDVAVTYNPDERPLVRVVEVQHRSTKIGSEFVDRIVGKAEALGAARATMVSAAGFTKPALARVRSEGHRLDAVHLRIASEDEWPNLLKARSFPFYLDEGEVRVPLAGRVYEDAATGTARFFVAYTDVCTPSFTGGATFLFRPGGERLNGDRPFGLRVWFGVEDASLPPGFHVKATMRAPDGSFYSKDLPVRSIKYGKLH